MFAALLLLLTGGIGFAIAASDPASVTLRWLRLGGLVAATLLGVAVVVHRAATPTAGAVGAVGLGLTAAAVTAQLIAVQLGRTRVQRLAAVACFLLAVETALALLAGSGQAPMILSTGTEIAGPSTWQLASQGTTGQAVVGMMALTAVLLGTFTMTMLLGHAYLTSGNEMTQRPFRRLVRCLAVALLMRAMLSLVTALIPWIHGMEPVGHSAWTMMLIIARYAVGMLVPGIFLYMIHDCVNRAANQSATGILYVTLVLVIIGEGSALSLLLSTGMPF